MNTIILNKKEISALLRMKDVIDVVEQAFRDWSTGKGEMPPKSYITVPGGDFRAMPASLPGAAGLKWVNVHPGNREKCLPTVMALIIYSDITTGYPLAVMDGTDITAFRTGATAAVAAKYLARSNSKTLGIVGAGRQAETQILAHSELFRFKEIRVYDIFPVAIDHLKTQFPGFNVQAATLEGVMSADIICTVTPARAPIVKKEWVKPGVHINAIGADAAGKEELEPGILNMGRVVVDDYQQAIHAGEINVPITAGSFKKEEIYASLGQIILGQKSGRTDNEQITIFDSTGVAIEDIAVAKLIYESALKQKTGLKVNILE